MCCCLGSHLEFVATDVFQRTEETEWAFWEPRVPDARCPSFCKEISKIVGLFVLANSSRSNKREQFSDWSEGRGREAAGGSVKEFFVCQWAPQWRKHAKCPRQDMWIVFAKMLLGFMALSLRFWLSEFILFIGNRLGGTTFCKRRCSLTGSSKQRLRGTKSSHKSLLLASWFWPRSWKHSGRVSHHAVFVVVVVVVADEPPPPHPMRILLVF